jgi:hypothetical protein
MQLQPSFVPTPAGRIDRETRTTATPRVVHTQIQSTERGILGRGGGAHRGVADADALHA